MFSLYHKNKKLIVYCLALVVLLVIFIPYIISTENRVNTPLIAIANYGPHSSLIDTISGIKSNLEKLGYKENQNIRYEITDVNYDISSITQMITKLISSRPDVLIAISTPVAQAAKNLVKDIPIVFANVTDPDTAGLTFDGSSNNNITGASDKNDLFIVLEYILKLIPKAKNIGVLYSTAEANDFAMLEMLESATQKLGLKLLAVSLDHTRDAFSRMIMFRDKVDCLYTGSSGVVQSALVAIASSADLMKIPHFNFNGEDVKLHNAFASYGVDYLHIGFNVAKIVNRILIGESVSTIPIIYPEKSDYTAFISKQKAIEIGFNIPNNLDNIFIVD
ncbi:ABC transporter substrate-binding protein [Rickettsia endosymbiont of Cardiosporidium cionae]|uniref:ABC transporter substrate-binding protein n=1 Tax=Rickettsia endosymbiont of Cardiosporidium cionae TaxID=2777155 RepID=UPI001895C801|nr:ABC transporter substrate-binding protein [Rickettsia endosymbiont of Cardiosporidium cionae]KAF8818213.1 hypothetical protein IHI24_000670 [Rickettsia endosymbiont of Cardiosporidium cionae]